MGHNESLGTVERNEAETRAGAVRTVNRPQTLAPQKRVQNRSGWSLLLSPRGLEPPHTPQQGQARGQDSGVARSSGRSLGVTEVMQKSLEVFHCTEWLSGRFIFRRSTRP